MPLVRIPTDPVHQELGRTVLPGTTLNYLDKACEPVGEGTSLIRRDCVVRFHGRSRMDTWTQVVRGVFPASMLPREIWIISVSGFNTSAFQAEVAGSNPA